MSAPSSGAWSQRELEAAAAARLGVHPASLRDSPARPMASVCDGGCGHRVLAPAQRAAHSALHQAQARLVLGARILGQRLPSGPVRRPPLQIDSGALRSSRDYQQYLSGRWRGLERPASAAPENLRFLRDRTLLHLGESKELGTLVAVIPRGFQPMTDPDDMLADFAPADLRADPLADPMLSASVEVQDCGCPMDGLFWRGWPGARVGGWTHATASARQGKPGSPWMVGPLRTSGRAEMEAAELRSDSLGRVSMGGPSRTLAWGHDGVGHALDGADLRVGMADYHLWWAHRLHGYAHEVSKSPWDLYLGRKAAAIGLREVRRLARSVTHVDNHLSGRIAERST